MIVKDFLIEQLETFNIPVILQGAIAPGVAYPKEFITFQTMPSDTPQSYDNDNGVTVWTFNVNYYSNNPDDVAEMSQRIYNTLKSAGFIPQGKGHDVLSDDVNFTGWGFDFDYIESEV